ncbi:MAG TPA: ThuA domain-containing protein, partial [Longimicrobiales bacterium]|nr:ThuA domain-containing protein [Longimicrobiales bacterium]
MARVLLVGAALVALLAGCDPATDGLSAQSARILVLSRTAGYRHASIEPAIEALRARAREAGVGLDATEDPEVFRPSELARYRAVVFLSTTGDVLAEPEQAALEAYVRGGGGFAGIHSAADTEYDWPWYGELVGAYFESHPPGVHEATLHVIDRTHPATASLPDPWTRSDEWYDFRDVQPGLHALLAIDEHTYKDPADAAPESRPIAW